MSYHSPTAPTCVLAPNLYDVPVALRCFAADVDSNALVHNVHLLRDCVAVAGRRWDFEIEAAVVLPAELHLLAVFRTGEFGIRQAAALIQSVFDRHVEGEWSGWDGAARLTPVDPSATRLRRAFIEAAPVRRGLVDDPADWPYSSAHRSQAQVTTLGAAVA